METKPKKRRRALKITCIVLGCVLVLAVAALGWVGNFFFNFALNPKADVAFEDSPSSLVEGAPAAQVNPYVAADPDAWLAGHAVDAWLTSRDGLELHAYRADIPGGHRYAILCHGYKNQAKNMAAQASHFYDLGYSVLLPDARGHGLSQGDYIGMGWPERHDIVDWIATLVEADPQAEIVLYGVSMGGATVMMVSGEELPENVKCIVEDCGYSSVWDEFAGQLDDLYGLPPVPVLNALDVVCRIRAEYSIVEASAVDQVARSVTPTLFIHGDADAFVPFRMLDEVYNAAACEKERLVVEGAAHAKSDDVNPELYWTTVDGFLARHVGV